MRPGWHLPPLEAQVGPLSSDDPHLRVLIAHVGALAATLLILAIGPVPPSSGGAIIVVVGLSFLRTIGVRKRIARSTLALDAFGIVVLLAATGAPSSPFFPFVLAGMWWAAHVPGRHSALLYASVFVAAYALLVAPQAIRASLASEAIEHGTVVVIMALLSDWFVRVDKRALELNEALTVPAFGPEQLAIREGLLRALRTMDIPVDAVIAAGQVGLTAVQAELLAYLMLGLTNVEISDAVGVSEATVRYRLTRLYRQMGVKGRREAAEAGHALGLTPPAAKRATDRT